MEEFEDTHLTTERVHPVVKNGEEWTKEEKEHLSECGRCRAFVHVSHLILEAPFPEGYSIKKDFYKP